jgi:hypothetical protein
MTEKYPIGTRAESERLVRDWGFRHVYTWSDRRFVTLSLLLTSLLTILEMDITRLIVIEVLQRI